MKELLVLLTVLVGFSTQAQKIKFKIEGEPDTTVNLVKYFGKNLFYADTAEMKNGIVTFDASRQKPGMLALYIPGKDILQFVYNGEKETYIEATGPNYTSNAVAKKSEENKLFYEYVQFLGKKKPEASRLSEQQKMHKPDSDAYKKLGDQIDSLNQEVENYLRRSMEDNEGLLTAKIIKMTREVETPEPPRDAEGNMIDSNFRFKYFREHFWDNIDLSDDRLVRTPVFDNKFSFYFGKRMMLQHWDTIITHAFDFIDRLDPASDMFQYCVSTLTSDYEKSKVMGMDKVFIYLGKRYYCPDGNPIKVGDRTFAPVYTAEGEPAAHWVKKSQLNKLCEKVNTHVNLVMGAIPPYIKLRDTSDVTYHDFMSLDNEFTILYFWDPDCGHCKKITPKLQTLYAEKWKERDIEIFAVGKATDDLFEKWKKFIKKHNLEFINVGVTKTMYEDAMNPDNNQEKLREILKETTLGSLNYQQAYDIFATPKVWVLNKDKKIIAYSLTVSQLEDLMDKLQGKEDSEKIFPPEENKDDEQMH